jgi:hypothetical protein
MSNANVNSPNPNWHEQQDLIDRIAQLEQRLKNALAAIDSYQIEKGELIDKILELRIRLQNVVDILEK